MNWVKRLFGGRAESNSKGYVQLVSRLKELLISANTWGKRNGHPLYEKYPQYAEVQEIGKKLYYMGGIEVMRKAYGEVEGHIPHPGMSEYWWEGIGGWRA